MKGILIVGAGKIGFHLAGTLIESGYDVGVVEIDPARCARIAEELGITVIEGDGTDREILTDAGAEVADYIVATTGRDETNLAICQIAMHGFGHPFTIARVINPKNEKIFKLLGVDSTISTTAIAARTIGNSLPARGMRLSQIFSGGDVELAELELESGGPVIGLTVAQLALPVESLLISVIRDGKVLFPRGQTLLREGDKVFALARKSAVAELSRALSGKNL